MTNKPEHPMQPVYLDDRGVARFHGNDIVRFLLDDGPNDMNRLAIMPFSREDREQFAQLIGYSVSGAGDLSYMSQELIEEADAAVEALTKPQEPEVFTLVIPPYPPRDVVVTRLQDEYKQSIEYAAHPERAGVLINPDIAKLYWSNRAETLGYVLDVLGGSK